MQVFVHFRQAAQILAAGTALSLVSGAAFAADANAVAERIKALYAEQGGELSFANVKADGSDIVLEGTKIKLPTASRDEATVGDITLQNVQDAPDGGYSIDQVAVPDIVIRGEAGKDDDAIVKGMSMENVRIPPEAAKGPLDKMIFYDKLKIDEITFAEPGVDGALVKGFELALDTSNKADKISYDWSVADIDVTFEKGGKNPLAPLGMNTFNGTMNSKGTWSPKSGDTVLDQFEIDAKDLGKINITGSISGYDLAFIDALQKTQQTMKQAGDKDASGLAMLGLAEQLSLRNLSIRFDDNTLTQKLLDYYGKQQGSDGKTLGEQLKMMVPLMATQLKNPDFAQQLKVAADKYFSDPKSLTLSASPDQPVSFASIAAAASIDPTKIIPLLKVGVDANN